jgi:hypothetical protein
MPRGRGVPEEGGRIGEAGIVEQFLGKSHPWNWGQIEGSKEQVSKVSPLCGGLLVAARKNVVYSSGTSRPLGAQTLIVEWIKWREKRSRSTVPRY